MRPRDHLYEGLCGAAAGRGDALSAARIPRALDHGRRARAGRREGIRPQRRSRDAAGDDAAALCEQHAPASFEFLKVDVEGAEADVLRGGDFSRFRPKIIVVEAIKPLTLAPAWDEWEPLLARHGYAYVWDDELNRYYVAEEARALAAAPRRGTEVVRGRPADREFQAGAEDPTHPDHRLARLLAGADMAKLPLMDRGDLFDLLTAGVADLDRPASAADIAAISARAVRLSPQRSRCCAATAKPFARLIDASSIPMHSAPPAAASRRAMRGNARFVLPPTQRIRYTREQSAGRLADSARHADPGALRRALDGTKD